MKVEFPDISINGINRKAYAMNLSGGGSSPATLSISIVNDGSYFEPNNLIQYDVTIGSFYTFTGYIVTVSEKTSAAGNTIDLQFVDTSIKLDNIFVGLKGKHGPPQASLRTSESINQTVNLLELTPTITQDSSSVKKINNLSIFETKGTFPSENFIFIGDIIDPCKDLDEAELDMCDPCQSAIADIQQRKLECSKNRSFQILDVDYKFSDLIAAASARGIGFSENFANAFNYRAQYTGTLREVINNWCNDFGYTFYWDNNTVIFINLQTGIELNETTIESNFSNTCTIEEKTVSRSIEGNTKNINIAYFGKEGEIKEYNCDSSEGSGEVSTQTMSMLPISLERLMDGNRSLLSSSVYKSANNFRTIVTAGKYSKELRDLYCWTGIYGYTNPTKVKKGKHSLMGWEIKAVCHNATTDDQVNGYDTGLCRGLYNSILTEAPDKGAFYSKENIEKLKKAGAYFVIVEDFGTKAFDFESGVADTFCGRYWVKSINTSDAEIVNPDGTTSITKGVFGNIAYVIPELNINHPYIRSSKDKFLNLLRNNEKRRDTFAILLDRPSNWNPSPNSDTSEDFLKVVNSFKIEEVDYSDSYAGLQPGHKLFLVYSFNDSPAYPQLVTELTENATNSTENDEANTSDLGITNRKTYKVGFAIQPPGKKFQVLQVFMPSEQTYKIRVRPNRSNYSTGPIRAIIPKLEVIVTENNLVGNTNYVGVNVNYQNITEPTLGNLSRDNYRCYIDKDKIFTYADSIINDLSNDLPLIRKTINYTILGIPYYKITMREGLTNFSVSMDSGGTRTNLTFSNIFPTNKTDTVKRNELNYLLKHRPIRTYLNNTY